MNQKDIVSLLKFAFVESIALFGAFKKIVCLLKSPDFLAGSKRLREKGGIVLPSAASTPVIAFFQVLNTNIY